MATGVFLLAGLVAGCGTLDNKGGPTGNRPPEVFLVNVPPDGTISPSSLEVRWYGTDRDGRITRFDYTVVTEAELDSVAATLPDQSMDPVERFIKHVLTDEYPLWISIFADSVQNPNHDLVKLFASTIIAECDSVEDRRTDTLVPVNCVSEVKSQYFFLRAIDDQESVSKIKYRSFKRTNHWPETAISRSFIQTDEYLSLPKLSVTYDGISFAWEGEDQLDFAPPALPVLEFHWRVYGPYDEQPTIDDTLDENGQPRIPARESRNEDPLVGVWVKDTSTTVWDLWRHVDSVSGEDKSVTRSGWFAIVVTARDDGFVADETPAFGTFSAIFPQFEREVILVEDTWYGPDAFTNPAGNSNRNRPDSNQAFMTRLMDRVYPEWNPEEDMWWRHPGRAPGLPCFSSRPPFGTNCSNGMPLHLLASHRLVIYIDDDINNQIPFRTAPPFVQRILQRYLDVGGMLWIISRHGLIQDTETAQPSPAKLIDFLSNLPSWSNPFAVEYFDIEAMYYPGWRRQAVPLQTSGVLPNSNAEFIAAKTVGTDPNLPPVLELDSARFAGMYYPDVLADILREAGVEEVIGVPDVNFLVRGTESTPLYLFESWRPSGPIPPDNGPSFSHGRVVMQRFVGPSRDVPLYKTAYTTFPLYFMKEEQVMPMVESMVDWFMLPFELTP